MAREGKEIVYKLVSCVVLLGKHPIATHFFVQTNYENINKLWWQFSFYWDYSVSIFWLQHYTVSVARDGSNNL